MTDGQPLKYKTAVSWKQSSGRVDHHRSILEKSTGKCYRALATAVTSGFSFLKC